ncbi:MAG: ketopantoate reductase family protein [Bacillota bacterium]|nr:ketopantoate reductase family protein [Bacillota bacterium]
MRILVVGAGAVGGYFGGRLLEKGEDVTFLVRDGRRRQLKENGLVIESVYGNVSLDPKTIVAGEEAEHFDVILFSTKAYHLEKAIEDIRPYVSDGTIILPLLNGILHIDKLVNQFGEDKVIGGLCFIETTLDYEGKVIQTSPIHDLVFGERSSEKTERILELEKVFSGTKANFRLSDNINRDMWHKYLFISTMSGITTLFRSPIGPIREQESGQETIKHLSDELVDIMNRMEAPISQNIASVQIKQMDGLGFTMKSSMQRDMEKLQPVEADHLHGYLLKIARQYQIAAPVLEAIYANLKLYEGQLVN